MKRYHWLRLYSLMLMIVLFAVASLVGLRGAIGIYKEATRQRGIVRGVQSVNLAEEAIVRGLSVMAREAARDQYDRIVELGKKGDGGDMSEADLEGVFRTGYANMIIDEIGDDSGKIAHSLNSFLEADGLQNVRVTSDLAMCFQKDTDAKGYVTALRIKNVSVKYTDPETGTRNDSLGFSIQFPNATFHAGSDELFKYCMVARKGIYITGRTSSVIGDIYAGGHSADDSREAEIVYGETGTYGGLNILTTQLGIKADTIVSGGDININGSFAMFSPLDDGLVCFGQRMNEIEGFSKRTDYSLDGVFISTYRMDEAHLSEYNDIVRLIDTSLGKLGSIEIYYDSDNDTGYEGKYRKIVSSTDIELRNDCTGIVATPGNVIIHNDVNFEGIILCGDRIYTMGNNNIVAGAEAARSIIAEEVDGGYGYRVSDHIGGMISPGFSDPDYYVVPFRM